MGGCFDLVLFPSAGESEWAFSILGSLLKRGMRTNGTLQGRGGRSNLILRRTFNDRVYLLSSVDRNGLFIKEFFHYFLDYFRQCHDEGKCLQKRGIKAQSSIFVNHFVAGGSPPDDGPPAVRRSDAAKCVFGGFQVAAAAARRRSSRGSRRSWRSWRGP